jgi:hypothetical protein
MLKKSSDLEIQCGEKIAVDAFYTFDRSSIGKKIKIFYMVIHHLRKSFTLFLYQPHHRKVTPENFCGRGKWMQNKKYWRWNHPNCSIL